MADLIPPRRGRSPNIHGRRLRASPGEAPRTRHQPPLDGSSVFPMATRSPRRSRADRAASRMGHEARCRFVSGPIGSVPPARHWHPPNHAGHARARHSDEVSCCRICVPWALSSDPLRSAGSADAVIPVTPWASSRSAACPGRNLADGMTGQHTGRGTALLPEGPATAHGAAPNSTVAAAPVLRRPSQNLADECLAASSRAFPLLTPLSARGWLTMGQPRPSDPGRGSAARPPRRRQLTRRHPGHRDNRNGTLAHSLREIGTQGGSNP